MRQSMRRSTNINCRCHVLNAAQSRSYGREIETDWMFLLNSFGRAGYVSTDERSGVQQLLERCRI